MIHDSEELAKKIRVDALKMIHAAQASHIGSILSMADLIAVLYADVLNITPERINDPKRDRFILSKGHAGAGVYAVLAECGFFDKKLLKTYYKNGSNLSGHVSSKGVPGVELSTGSLGHGCSVACGMALSSKIYKSGFNVYCIIGDGESEEGSVYEMAQFASKNRLNNLTIIMDLNGLQAMGKCDDIVGHIDRKSLWNSLGWNVLEIDGHNHNAIRDALMSPSEKPKLILAKTTKGNGVSFMENDNIWHYRPPNEQLLSQALQELEGHY